MPRVVIQEGPGSGKTFEIEQAAILGRLDTNDIPVRDSKASREHAKIYRQGDQYAIVDLNSSNGTFVNGEQVTKRILKPGDVIEIGVVKMLFEDAEAAKTGAAAGQRKGLDEAFESARKQEGAPAGGAAAAAAGGGPADVKMRGHQPLQFSRVKPGRSLLGFDMEQLSDTARFLIYLVAVVLFAALAYLAYALVAP